MVYIILELYKYNTVPRTERQMLIDFLQEQSESLAKGLRLLSELEGEQNDH